jgi:hypothetical protein
MSLNAKIRHLVMNRTNQAIAPRDELLDGFDPADLKARGEIPKKYSPSFVNEGTARGFAAALAAKYPGERFYVAKVVAGCTKSDVQWSEATPVTSLADEATADDLGAGDNE